MKAIDWILRCYPPRWRERYQEEILALLEQHTITSKTLLDLLLGALDARLDPTYRSKEGIMFKHIRDMRSLSIIYICALIVFLFSATFWLMLNGSLAFQDNALGSTTETLGSICVFIVPLIGLIALLCIAYVEFKNSLQHQRWGIPLFALVCLGLAPILLSNAISFPPSPDFPLIVYIPDLLLVIEMAMLLSVGLFISGIKGLQLLMNGQKWLVFFVLILELLLPLSQVAYSLWGLHGNSGGTTYLASGYFLLGNVAFPSVASFLTYLTQDIAPYLTLGGLLLALVHDPLTTRSIHIAQRFGILIVLLLAFNLAIIVIWDVNRWLGGHVWVFDPTVGVWPLFHGQWISALITNVLILALTLGITLIALIRSFTIQSNTQNNVEHRPA